MNTSGQDKLPLNRPTNGDEERYRSYACGWNRVEHGIPSSRFITLHSVFWILRTGRRGSYLKSIVQANNLAIIEH